MTSAPTPVRVLLADDQELVRHGFAALIEAEPDLTVVGQATSGAEAIDLAYLTRPDVVLMDIRMPRLDGIAATQRITSDQRLAEVRILVLTTFGTDEYIYGALRAGASRAGGRRPGEQPPAAAPRVRAALRRRVARRRT